MPLSDGAPATRYGLPTILGVFALLCFGCALVGLFADRSSTLISQYFLATQDTPVLFALGFACVALALVARRRTQTAAPAFVARVPGFGLAIVLAIIAAGIAYLGAYVVQLNHPLSIDEFLANFDAKIFASGHLIAPVAPEWRDYVPAMQPVFRLPVPDNAFWVSSYLPMNAAIRALFVVIGDAALENAVLAGVAIVALYGVARRLWPDRPDAAAVSVVLLACSSQFLITAMTPYAMTAHLAFNLVWLWLFLRDTRASHACAAGVAFIACGLHQVVFHPLFAAPFVLSLFIARRWRLAAYYTLVYAASAMFWILYWKLLLHGVGAPSADSADVGMGNFVHRVLDLIGLDATSIALMSLNLVRFLAWQAPITLPLAVVGLLASRRDPVVNKLALGMVFMLGLVLIVLPYQGHGWGYRYLHGFLGSISLIAAQGWIVVFNGERVSRPIAAAFVSSAVFALLVLLPWRAWQVRSFVAPHAAFAKVIANSRAPVVVVDAADVWNGADMIRNDPLLRMPPKVIVLGYLDEAALKLLCRRYDVDFFDRNDVQRLGLRTAPSTPNFAERSRTQRELMKSLDCGRPGRAGGS